MPGKLIVVATPIGNLSDLSGRATEALADADLIACEDTRRTGKMLAGLRIKKRLVSLHEHNERQQLPRLLAAIDNGQTVVLVSDAGTPLLSDPGYVFVRSAIASGIPVEHVPGPSAILTALVVSGLPPYPFTFAGFPPPRSAKRKKFFSRLAGLDHTVVMFESPHRITRSLDDLYEVLGNRPIAAARELTKLHEEVVRGSVLEVLEVLRERPSIKGEFTVVVGKPIPETS
jgi:16S rRNA (cytidine1402-2'-O)-methyltransferase